MATPLRDMVTQIAANRMAAAIPQNPPVKMQQWGGPQAIPLARLQASRPDGARGPVQRPVPTPVPVPVPVVTPPPVIPAGLIPQMWQRPVTPNPVSPRFPRMSGLPPEFIDYLYATMFGNRRPRSL